ncbi:ribokinase [Roseibium denhamense]|uniref:Ribokinase n=1 Tax=Roseibium denhamense TaxID=76305 RepID=A0ABY1NZN1_9HYPH|nr:ribokinase [Roseibium denhamense]MTI05098.1 ribokinase [Roseibium denhamense]SMP22877.1 ribokinase [Roseibium denhamense]
MITVFGSINLDLVVALPRLPKAGETVSGPDHQLFAGGKGANQALAARRAGASVKMVGAVGTDAFAALAIGNMEDAGVDLASVRTLDGATGLAFIGIDPDGENQIMVASGANHRVEAKWLGLSLAASRILLLQGEVPFPEIRKAMQLAQDSGAEVIWNLAPVPDDDIKAALATVNTLIVNETEAAEIARKLAIDPGLEAFLDYMVSPARKVVVTLGSKGVVAASHEDRYRIASPKIEAVDTTGAGDAFCGAFAAAADAGTTFERALKAGVAAGTLACTVTGAQSSAPMKAEIERLADQITAADFTAS